MMLLSENLYFLILFTLPAALHIIYHTHIRHAPQIKTDKSVELAECIIFCFAVFFCNLIIMEKDMIKLIEYLASDDKESFSIIMGFNYVNFMIKYFKVNAITSITVIVLWYGLLKRIYKKLVNIHNEWTGKYKELEFSDTWRNVFETKEIVDVGNCVLCIEKSGQLVTAGILAAYPAPHIENKEIVLHSVDFVKQLFEDDKNEELQNRIFTGSICEFYDIGNDLLIKFYSIDKYDEYCKNRQE